MKLRSIQIAGERAGSWVSPRLEFARDVTQLYGPNGCGKTPVIQSVAFALGYPVTFRDDVREHCESVVLELASSSGEVCIRRRVSAKLDVEVSTKGGETRSYYSEREFSAYIFELFGFAFPALTTTSGEASTPYVATILPLFYLDQDHGYTSAYRPPKSFIRDQYAEMMRCAFGLAPKHSYDVKKHVLARQRELERLDRAIVHKRGDIEALARDSAGARRSLVEIEAEIDDTRIRLERLKSSHDLRSDAQIAIDTMLHHQRTRHRAIGDEVAALELRISGLTRIRQDVDAEVRTLSLNEEARGLFSSFTEICANESCGLFLGSSESYGKNLLYLKDQVKDLETTVASYARRLETLRSEQPDVAQEIRSLEERQRDLSVSDEVTSLIETARTLTERLIALQRELRVADQLERDEAGYIELLNARERTQNEIASIEGSGRSSDLRLLSLRSEIRSCVAKWLDVLQTKNVSREVTIDSDFDISFGAERVNQLTGSTLLRAVLAIRTAVYEVYARDPRKLLRFLILDTPRQQDIERDALEQYVAELKRLCSATHSQVVFSTTDYRYAVREGDTEWRPQFDGIEQKMFLRALGV